jgi:hypothetical protein
MINSNVHGSFFEKAEQEMKSMVTAKHEDNSRRKTSASGNKSKGKETEA